MKDLRVIVLLTLATALPACGSSGESDWNEAQAANTATAYQAFLEQHPTDAHAQQARDRLQKMAAAEPVRTPLQKPQPKDYRVQVGIFPRQKDAENSRESLQTQLGGELQELVVIPPSDSETSYRLASEPMTADDAENACAKLIAEDRHCEVVKR